MLVKLNPEDTNSYKLQWCDKYEIRPNCLKGTCYADFATNYLKPDDNEESGGDDALSDLEDQMSNNAESPDTNQVEK